MKKPFSILLLSLAFLLFYSPGVKAANNICNESVKPSLPNGQAEIDGTAPFNPKDTGTNGLVPCGNQNLASWQITADLTIYPGRKSIRRSNIPAGGEATAKNKMINITQDELSRIAAPGSYSSNTTTCTIAEEGNLFVSDTWDCSTEYLPIPFTRSWSSDITIASDQQTALDNVIDKLNAIKDQYLKEGLLHNGVVYENIQKVDAENVNIIKQSNLGGPACPCTISHIWILLFNLYKFAVFTIALPLAGLIVVLGGVLYIFAGASPGLANTGKTMLWSAAIAIVLMFGSWLIIDVVLKAIGYVVQWNILPF